MKDGGRGRRSDGGEDRASRFASESHRWRVMIMQLQTEGREGRGEGETVQSAATVGSELGKPEQKKKEKKKGVRKGPV